MSAVYTQLTSNNPTGKQWRNNTLNELAGRCTLGVYSRPTSPRLVTYIAALPHGYTPARPPKEPWCWWWGCALPLVMKMLSSLIPWHLTTITINKKLFISCELFSLLLVFECLQVTRRLNGQEERIFSRKFNTFGWKWFSVDRQWPQITHHHQHNNSISLKKCDERFKFEKHCIRNYINYI